MSAMLAKSHCTIHFDRAASARCPACRRFFCGECVTEHGGRLVCASCLGAQAEARKPPLRRRIALYPASWLQGGLALFLVWVLFYYFARFLAEIPDAFHDGTIWE
jgi:hypothetical protein